MGEMIADGAEFSCTLCDSKIKMIVPSCSTTGDGKKIANKGNHILLPAPMCKINPAAPPPCVPSVTITDPGQSPNNIDDVKGLGKGCKGICARGGSLSLSDAAQKIFQHDGAGGAGAIAAITGAVVDAAGSGGGEESKDVKKKKDQQKKKNEAETEKVLDKSKKDIDNTKQHLKGGPKGELQASLREAKGEVVCMKKNGKPFDHINEVQETQQKLKKTIQTLNKKVVGNPKATTSQSKRGEALLSEASKILDHSEGFVKSKPFKSMKGPKL